MSKIGLIGSPSFNNQTTIFNIFKKIKGKYGPYAEILSGGTNTGAEYLVKKIALELGFQYKEYNPSYTGMKIYSAMPREYYGKGYHFSHLTDRYKHLVNECAYIIVFLEKGINLPPELKYAIQYAQKNKKKLVIIS